jgi:hypothetical protein
VAAAVFLTLTGTGISYALWTASTSVNGSVSTGTVTVGLTARGLNAMSFGNDLTPVTGSITVHNTNTASGGIAVFLASTDAFAATFDVKIWSVSDTSTCTTAVAPVSSSGTWSAASVTGTLGAGASASYCVRTTVADRASVVSTHGTITVPATITATLAVHNWTGAATQPATMTTNRIFPAVTTVVGDTFSNNGQCVQVTDGTDPGSTPPPCAATITPMNGIKVQGPVSTAGDYQLVADDGECLQVDATAVITKPCSGDPTQLFTLQHPPAPTTPPAVAP